MPTSDDLSISSRCSVQPMLNPLEVAWAHFRFLFAYCQGGIFRQGLVHDVGQMDGLSKHNGAQRSKWLSAVPLSRCHPSTEIFYAFHYFLLTCTNRKPLRPATARSHGASLPWPPAYVRKNCGGLHAYPSLLIRAHGWPHGCSDSEPVPGRPWVQGLGQRWLPTS